VKVLVFGATGAAGSGILSACLASPMVSEVRAIARRPPQAVHDKLRVIIHQDFADYSGAEEVFRGLDACFFALGTSVTQVPDEAAYRRITYDFAVAAAQSLKSQSPGSAFHYISGGGTRTDSRMMWARVKGATEQELIRLVGAVCWRPGFIDTPPSDSEPWLYRTMKPAFRLLRPFRSLYIHGEALGRAMIQTTGDGVRGRVFENAEIRAIDERARAQ
jgi:hypothetical protein